MSARARDRLGSVLVLLFTLSLWVQRSYMTPFGGMFPDFVMVVLAVIVVLTLALSFTSRPAMKEAGAEKAGQPSHWKAMAVVGAILIAWGVLLRQLGFAVTGVLGFTAISWYLAVPPRGVAGLLRSVVVAVAVTGLLVLVFGWMLKVPLPRGTVFT